MGFMVLVPLLVLGLVVWVVMEGTRRHDQQVYPSVASPYSVRPEASRPDARALLDNRYARGEVERQEYLQRREDLAR